MAAAAACIIITTGAVCSSRFTRKASLSLLSTGCSQRRRKVSLSAVNNNNNSLSPLLHSSFVTTTSSSLSLSSRSTFSGLSLGVDMNFTGGAKVERSYRLVVRAKKFLLCQTKRNRSRKSLARTHGFKVRMSTTSGRAVLKRRRAKGRWILCTKTNHNSGKRP